MYDISHLFICLVLGFGTQQEKLGSRHTGWKNVKHPLQYIGDCKPQHFYTCQSLSTYFFHIYRIATTVLLSV